MQAIGMAAMDDARWMATFPQVVAPLPGEWLLGLLLRCDEANGWPAGAAATSVFNGAIGPSSLARPSNFITARVLDLALLAQRLGLEESGVLETTFRPALARLYGAEQPHARSLGPCPTLRICPQCVRQQRLIRRDSALSALMTCAEHGLVLQDACLCGAPLRAFGRGMMPFACAGCGRSWDSLAAPTASPGDMERDARKRALYALFLERASTRLTRDALRLIRQLLSERGLRRVPTEAGSGTLATRYYSGRVSLSLIVAALDALDVYPDCLDPEAHDKHHRHDGRCLNRTCPLFDVEGADNIHRCGARAGSDETYCDICGSRFWDGRIILSFDEGCDPAGLHPRPRAIAKAQARLNRWREGVSTVCEHYLADQTPISLLSVYTAAGVPRTPNLRAKRLGLASIVEEYAEAQQLTLPLDGMERWEMRQHMHRRVKKSG